MLVVAWNPINYGPPNASQELGSTAMGKSGVFCILAELRNNSEYNLGNLHALLDFYLGHGELGWI